MKSISIMGTGAMGSAIMAGLIQSAQAEPSNIRVYDVSRPRLDQAHKEFGVQVVNKPEQLLEGHTGILLLAVKPQNMHEALKSLGSSLNEGALVISIAAGVTSEFILSRLGGKTRLIRSMPNAAAIVRQSATAICKAGGATDHDIQLATEFFASIGQVVVVEEKLMNAVTALSGSGPGYLFAIMEALTDAGVLAGLSRDVSRKLTLQTVIGSATMALDSKLSFSHLKDQITSPAGTTISGLQVIERSGLRGTIMDAVEAAKRRADQLM